MDKKLILEIKRTLTIINSYDKTCSNFINEDTKCFGGYQYNTHVKQCVKKENVISQSELFEQDEKKLKQSERDKFNQIYNSTKTQDTYDYTGGIGVNVGKIPNLKLGSLENPFVKPEVVIGLTDQEKEKIKEIKNKIIKEVKGGWAPWKWGTDEKGLVDSLEYITNDLRYEYLFYLLVNDKKYGYEVKMSEAILPWLQLQEFSTGQDREFTNPETGKPWTRNPFDELQYLTNDKYLFRMEQILSKFNELETYETQDVKLTGKLDAEVWKAVIPPATREILHVGLALGSLVLSFGNSWPAVIASFSVEVLDAAIYKFLDEDDYGAGLALAFAFAGPIDKTLGIISKTVGVKILTKLSKGGKMSVAEKLGLKYIARHASRIANLTRIGMILDTIKVTFSRFKTANQILKGIFTISKVLGSFLFKGGLMIGGSFLTWDYMAKQLKICNSMPLAPLKQNNYWVLKLIGNVGEFIQPFSTPCETEKIKKILDDYQEELKNKMNQKITYWLQQMIDKNLVLSFDTHSDIEIPETGVIQVLLKYFGYTSPQKSPTGKIIEFDPFYYDENTKLAVEEFQKDENLSAKDGMIGPESLKKLKSMVQILGNKQIPKYPDFDLKWSQKQIDKMKSELKQKIEDQEKINNNKVVSPEKIEDGIINQKDSIKTDFENRIKRIDDFTDDDVYNLNVELKKIK